MLDAGGFVQALSESGVEFFCGVPDSLLKHFCNALDSEVGGGRHIVAANEGSAIAIASGFHLASGTTPLVYLQNAGQGNTLNPLISLADPSVYSIPILIMVGWRGEPGLADEPQHSKQGSVTEKLYHALDIPTFILPNNEEEAIETVQIALKTASVEKRPVSLIVRSGTFDQYPNPVKDDSSNLPLREEALRTILEHTNPNSLFLTTTGKTSREIFEIREELSEPHSRDFLVIGSMGHCSQIALGISISGSHREIVCIDGDGAALMHLGGLASIGRHGKENFRHFLINNGVHESVGGLQTTSPDCNFAGMALACGYKWAATVRNLKELGEAINNSSIIEGPTMIEVVTTPGSRSDLGRPHILPIDAKEEFMGEFGHAQST